jgi:hypothetical protein
MNKNKSLKIVDQIFEGYSSQFKQTIKEIIRGESIGTKNNSLFESVRKSDMLPAHHLYNFLYENNALSKYVDLAEEIDYPSSRDLYPSEEEYLTSADNLLDLLKFPPENVNRKEGIIYTKDGTLDGLSWGKEMIASQLMKKYGYKVEKEENRPSQINPKLLAWKERQKNRKQ